MSGDFAFAKLILLTCIVIGSVVCIATHEARVIKDIEDRIEQIQNVTNESEKERLKEELAKLIKDNTLTISDKYRVYNGKIQHNDIENQGVLGVYRRWHSIDHCKKHL